jgi:hypothetical protein
LTRGEASSLNAKLAQIRSLEARLRFRGLNGRERVRIQNQLNKLNADINFQLNDRQNRFNHRRHAGIGRYYR